MSLETNLPRDGLGYGNVMQKKKTAETQVQQELSSNRTATRRSRTAWIQPREPMTGAQAASLKRLADEIREPHAFDAGLSKSEATRRIDRVEDRGGGRGARPP